MADDETPSMQDRIAAAMGFPGKDADGVDGAPAVEHAEAAVTADPDFAEIEWEGGSFKVPKALKDAFMFNKDYTQKTQTLAEQQRALEHSRELMTRGQMDTAFRESITNESRELAVIDAYLSEASKANWSTMNMETLMRTRAELDQVKERRQSLKESIEGKRGQFNEEMKTKLSELRAKSRELAAKSIPGFGEEAEKSVREYAKTEGLTDSEIDNVLLDPRSAKVLWKAMQFVKVQAGTTKAVESASKALKPGPSHEKMPEDVKAKLNFRKDMKGAKTSAQKAQLIEDRLAGGIFSRGH
jgi:hypothetical protein